MNHCALCKNDVGQRPIVDDNQAFCCLGCQTVFKILSTKNLLDHFSETELFKQAVQSGLISNPALIEQIRENQPHVPESERQKLHLEIEDLWCPSCAEVIRLLLLRQKGVINCIVDYATDLASIEYAPRFLSKDKILNTIRKLGYHPTPLEEAQKRAVSLNLYLRFIVAAFFALNIMMFSYPLYASYFTEDDANFSLPFVWINFFSSLPVITYSAWPIWRRLWNGLKVGFLGMESLILLGVSSAFALSTIHLLQGENHVYFDSMCIIIAFVLLGKIIESKAKFSAKDSLLQLSRALPKRGRKRLQNGEEQFVPMKEISEGDLLVVVNGEKIVLDGVVVEGEGACDEAIMTGEAVPVRKKTGSMVIGGTLLNQGNLVYRVTATEDRTALHQIITVVEQDLSHKSVYNRAVDPIVRWFVPLVIVIALGTILGAWTQGLQWDESILRGISVLLISCPCAIGIAAPLAESQILHSLAKLGAIVRNRGCLQFLGRETSFVFDKTGTVTEGHFKVLDGIGNLETYHQKILKGLSQQSNHPIATAIHQKIEGEPLSVSKIEELPGKGMQGEYEEKKYFLGSASFLQHLGIRVVSPQTAMTTTYFADEDKVLTALLLGDRTRQDSLTMIKSLKPVKSILLSGDHCASVKRVAEECGFDEWQSDCSPLEKRDYIDRLRQNGEIVSMMGDGINDAPALSGAHVGISVVTATDVSIQVSDLMLTTDRLSVIPKMRRLAQKGQKIVKQNLFWAFFYNVIGIGFAVTGILHPLVSASAMILSSLIVLFNSKRIN